MTLAVFFFFNLPQNIVCSGKWLPPKVCVTVFLTERECEKEGLSSNVKRKPRNMVEGSGLQTKSLFLLVLLPGASVSNWPSSLMRVSKQQKQSGSLPFSLSYLLFSSTLSFHYSLQIFASPALPILQEHHTICSSPTAIIRHQQIACQAKSLVELGTFLGLIESSDRDI